MQELTSITAHQGPATVAYDPQTNAFYTADEKGILKTTSSDTHSIAIMSNNKQDRLEEPYRLKTMRFERDLSSPAMEISNSSKFLVNHF